MNVKPCRLYILAGKALLVMIFELKKLFIRPRANPFITVNQFSLNKFIGYFLSTIRRQFSVCFGDMIYSLTDWSFSYMCVVINKCALQFCIQLSYYHMLAILLNRKYIHMKYSGIVYNMPRVRAIIKLSNPKSA